MQQLTLNSHRSAPRETCSTGSNHHSEHVTCGDQRSLIVLCPRSITHLDPVGSRVSCLVSHRKGYSPALCTLPEKLSAVCCAILLKLWKGMFNAGVEVLLLILTPGVANWDITSGSDTGQGIQALSLKYGL